jgi:VWFA-related protein
MEKTPSALTIEAQPARRLMPRCRDFHARAFAIAFSISIAAGCSSSTAPPYTAGLPTGAPSVVAEPPVLDLCPLLPVAPAALRTKPGYLEFAVSAVDATGTPLTGLKQSDFVVRDAARAYPIAYFKETSAKTPASLFIVGDASATMYDKTVVKSGDLTKIRATLNRAAEGINDCDEVGVAVGGGRYAPNFGPTGYGLPPSLSDVTLLQPFTTEHSIAMTKIENVIPAGPNHLPDAIKLALTQLGGAHYPVRALVIVTDGVDQSAIDESARILEQARPNGIAVMIIGIGDPDVSASPSPSLKRTTRLDRAALKHLAAAGKGEVLLARAVDDDSGASLAGAIGIIAKQLDQSYAVGIAAPGAKAPTLAMTTPGAAMLRASIVPSQVLADAASRPPPPPEPQCIPKEESKPPPAISARPGYTQLRVAVTDADGKALRGLKRSDFALSSGAQALPIIYFHEDGGESPRSVVIAIDTSGSMQNKLAAVRRELGKMLRGLNPCDEVALFAFSGKAFLLQSFTTDHRLVERRLALLHAYGPTALNDAINDSLALLSRAKYPDRAVILLTDGMDNVSKTSSADVLDTVAHKGVPIYIVGIGEPMASPQTSIAAVFISTQTPETVDNATLDKIAARAGGEDFIVPEMSKDQGEEFARAVAAIGERLERGYEIGYVASSSASPPTIAVVNQPDDVFHINRGPSSSNDSTSKAQQPAVTN